MKKMMKAKILINRNLKARNAERKATREKRKKIIVTADLHCRKDIQRTGQSGINNFSEFKTSVNEGAWEKFKNPGRDTMNSNK